MTDFLDEDYEVPNSGSNYTKLEKGETRLRILSKPLLGWQGWKDKKPHRFKYKQKPDDVSMFDKQEVKHLWVMKVWNFNENRVQVWEITQMSIQKFITGLNKSEDWGNPLKYNITVTKTGEGKQTEYSVTPVPPKELPDDAKKIITETPVNLEALYEGKDPFEPVKQPIIEEPIADDSGSNDDPF